MIMIFHQTVVVILIPMRVAPIPSLLRLQSHPSCYDGDPHVMPIHPDPVERRSRQSWLLFFTFIPRAALPLYPGLTLRTADTAAQAAQALSHLQS